MPRQRFSIRRGIMSAANVHRLCLFLSTILILASLGGCRQEPSGGGRGVASAPTDPGVTRGLEVQSEDFARARSAFHTKLLRKAPAPQPSGRVHPPFGVAVIEYQSGQLRLKAWTDRLALEAGRKLPAVLYLHGGFAFGEDDWEQAQPFRDAGFIVMTPLLRGENGQGGSFTMFYDEVDDALAAAEKLATLPGVDPQRLYLAGHSAGGTLTMLAAMASKRFRAAAALAGSPDQISFVRSGWPAPFDESYLQEFRLRSPVAYATSFKCPARLYMGSVELAFHASTRRTAQLARDAGLDVEAVVVPGDHFSSVPEALRQAIMFFKGK